MNPLQALSFIYLIVMYWKNILVVLAILYLAGLLLGHLQGAPPTVTITAHVVGDHLVASVTNPGTKRIMIMSEMISCDLASAGHKVTANFYHRSSEGYPAVAGKSTRQVAYELFRARDDDDSWPLMSTDSGECVAIQSPATGRDDLAQIAID